MQEANNTKRIGLIGELFRQKEVTSQAIVRYSSIPKIGDDDSALYVREVHFIAVVQPGAGKTMSEIAEALAITPSAVTQIAARLLKKGYIEKERSKKYHKQVIAHLTEKGERVYNELYTMKEEEIVKMDEELFSQFTDEQLELLLNYERLTCSLVQKWSTPSAE